MRFVIYYVEFVISFGLVDVSFDVCWIYLNGCCVMMNSFNENSKSGIIKREFFDLK